MRPTVFPFVILPLIGLALTGAGEPPPNALDNPAYVTPPDRWESLEDALRTAERPGEPGSLDPPYQAPDDPEYCRDRIHEARAASGQAPYLDRTPASPDRPLAIYALDRRQDGCSVLVMMGDREDIRPLPAPATDDGPFILVEEPVEPDAQ